MADPVKRSAKIVLKAMLDDLELKVRIMIKSVGISIYMEKIEHYLNKMFISQKPFKLRLLFICVGF